MEREMDRRIGAASAVMRALYRSFLHTAGDAEHLSKAAVCRRVRKVCLALKRLLPRLSFSLDLSEPPRRSWGVDSEDELPPGIPSATGLPVYWLRAPLPPRGGGAAGPPPALRASASSLLAE